MRNPNAASFPICSTFVGADDFPLLVIYFQGHQEYIDYSHSRERGPWTTLKGNIRAVEFCKVENLEYATVSGSGDSCCKMMLKFVDPESSVYDSSFKLTLPEETGFPDFLVERTRFDAAMLRNWTCRDKCRVWWKNEGEEDGSWWDGRILSVKAKSCEFPDSPWERCTVQYKTEPTETHLHSPWELFDADALLEQQQPHIDEHSRDKLLSALAKLEQSANKVKVCLFAYIWISRCSFFFASSCSLSLFSSGPNLINT